MAKFRVLEDLPLKDEQTGKDFTLPRGEYTATPMHGGANLDDMPITRWMIAAAGVGLSAAEAEQACKAGKLIIAQTANILLFIGERHALAPAALSGRLWTHQLQLTIADLVAEVHDTHHPISLSLYYEDQKREAKRRAHHLIKERLPKYLGYFETVLERNPRKQNVLVGTKLTYVDLSAFQLIEGLVYAFPKAMARLGKKHARLMRLHASVAVRPRIAAYLASERRIAYNEDDIFRRYPELDE